MADPGPADRIGEVPASVDAPALVDLAYRTADCPTEPSAAAIRCTRARRLDVLPRLDGARRGTLVYVHGGGFVGGDRTMASRDPIVWWVRRHGWDVVAVGYRLAADPRVADSVGDPYPAATLDVRAAIETVRAEAGRLGVDSRRVIVYGHSAGGTIAADAAVGSKAAVGSNAAVGADTDAARPDGWISVAGPLSARAGIRTRAWLQWWATGSGFAPESAAPAEELDDRDPPGYVAHGDDDSVVEPANLTEVHAAAQRTGARVTFDQVDHDDLGRPLDGFRNHGPQGGMNQVALAAWLNRVAPPET